MCFFLIHDQRRDGIYRNNGIHSVTQEGPGQSNGDLTSLPFFHKRFIEGRDFRILNEEVFYFRIFGYSMSVRRTIIQSYRGFNLTEFLEINIESFKIDFYNF